MAFFGGRWASGCWMTFEVPTLVGVKSVICSESSFTVGLGLVVWCKHLQTWQTGWWFQTCFIFHNIWNNHPNWLTNQQTCVFLMEDPRWQFRVWMLPKAGSCQLPACDFLTSKIDLSGYTVVNIVMCLSHCGAWECLISRVLHTLFWGRSKGIYFAIRFLICIIIINYPLIIYIIYIYIMYKWSAKILV